VHATVFDFIHGLTADPDDVAQLRLRHASFPTQALEATGNLGFILWPHRSCPPAFCLQRPDGSIVDSEKLPDESANPEIVAIETKIDQLITARAKLYAEQITAAAFRATKEEEIRIASELRTCLHRKGGRNQARRKTRIHGCQRLCG
jgi:hypothetical protein